MNSKRSYIEAINAGRQRRPYASLEQLNRSLKLLEQKLEDDRDESREDALGEATQADVTQAAQAADVAQVHVAQASASPQGRTASPLPEHRHAPEQPYQSIARDMERVREEENGVATFGRIAQEIRALQEELRRRTTSGPRRDFDKLRKNFPHTGSRAASASGSVRNDAALPGTAPTPGRSDDDRNLDRFRLDIAALADRIEVIGRAVADLPASLPLGALDEKVRMLATAFGQFIQHQDVHATQAIAQIDERLDEISRAIVSATVAMQQHADPQSFQRIEARISTLARQIEELVEDQSNDRVAEHLQTLSLRIEELAARNSMPDEAVERLAGQLTAIADRIDTMPAASDAGEILSGIEQRFDVLAGLFEQHQQGTLEQSFMLFGELERRLEEVAERIDRHQVETGLENVSIMKAIDQRFSELATTLDNRLNDRDDAGSNETIRGLEARLEDISRRLDQSATRFAGIDPRLVHSLEAQVASLSEHIARPGTQLPEFVDISPRLMEIERSIAESRVSILDAAHEAAETAVRSLASSGKEANGLSEMSEELRALEELTRRSDERNTRTFEAIHDTLLKIADRMESLESGGKTPAPKLDIRHAPSIDTDDELSFSGDLREDMDATATTGGSTESEYGDEDEDEDEENADRRSSLLEGFAWALGRKAERGDVSEAEMDKAPEFDLDTTTDTRLANRPLEPGSGAPDLNAIIRRVRDEHASADRHGETDTAKPDFIAAARRAASTTDAWSDGGKENGDNHSKSGTWRIGTLLKARRKPVLMTTTALLASLAALQLGKTLMSDAGETAAISEAAPISRPASGPASEQVDTAVVDNAGQDAGQAGLSARMAPEDRETQQDATADAPAHEPLDNITVASISSDTATPEETGAEPSISFEIPQHIGPQPLLDAAAEGDARALFEVAARHAQGRGTGADMAQAAQWYEKAAEQGLAPAQYHIANMYEKGIGVTRDLFKARDWYERAAEQGNASAMHNLAVLYATGVQDRPDNDKAAFWFVKAAELGVKDSQFNLGILSAKGIGMKQNLEESYKWFALVADTGDKDAISKRDEIGRALRPEQLLRARGAAELWQPRALDPAANDVDIPAEWRESGGQTDGLTGEQTNGIDMKTAIMTVQETLNEQGYEVGQADGVMGERTMEAVARFQADNGLEPTGSVNAELVRTLLARK